MKKSTVMFIVVIIMVAGIFALRSLDMRNQITANAVWDDEFMEGKKIVHIQTNKGLIITEIYEEKTPVTAKNFLDLTQQGFYNGLTFHRYVPGFVIQGGDPDGDGTGGSENTIPLEIVDGLRHEKGVLAMARSSDPNSASSQFYITLDAAPHLDGSYAIFGRVLEGMDIVLQLREGDVMSEVKIIE